jgi:hypothetical protein
MTIGTFFKRNEGRFDRAFRVILGLGILSLYFIGPQSPWALLGLIPLGTGLLGTCPLYSLLGMSTCPVQSPSARSS